MLNPRILMQQEDGSPGSGAQPSTPAPAPTEPPATGASPVSVDVAAIAAAVAQQVKDGVFADLRRAGVLGKEKPTKATTAEATTPAAPQQQPDIGKLRMLDRALTRSPHGSRLSDAGYSRLERAFLEESPADTASWLTDYFEGMGVVAPAAAPAATPPVTTTPAAPAAITAAPAPRTAVPVSGGGGSPPVPTVPLEDQDLLSLSDADKAHLIKQKGPRWYLDRIAEQSKGKSLRIR